MKKVYFLLEFEDISLVMTLNGMMKWLKDDAGGLEMELIKSYKISQVWLTKKEYNALKEADI